MPLPPPGDTIAAIATAPGEGAIGVLRIAGPDALSVADAIFVPRSGSRPSERRSHRVVVGQVRDQDGFVDQALLLTFRSPHSYTGQDAIEIQTHGGPAVLRRVLAASLRQGARAAGPGEFTLRAYLAGKMDLVEAEGVLGIVRARSERARRSAAQGLTGRLSAELDDLQDRLTAAYGDLTAVLDYPEEGVELRDVRPVLVQVRERIAKLLATVEAGALVQRGARLAIVGRPNAGKSSLLNALLGYERSIVSEVPGTTRDYLEAPLELGGVPLTAVDTAGVRVTDDRVEASGVQRALGLAEQADLVLCLLDASLPLEPADHDLVARLDVGRTLFVASKVDLPAAWSWDEARLPAGGLAVSATRGDGLDALRDAVRERLLGDAVGSELWIGHERHANALAQVDAALERGLGAPEDLMALDLQDALTSLAAITGRGDVAEEALVHIFANFCVGK